MDALCVWVTMRLRSREQSNLLQKKGEEKHFILGVSKEEAVVWW